MWVCYAGGRVGRQRRRGQCFNTCGFVASGQAADLAISMMGGAVREPWHGILLAYSLVKK